MVKDRYSWKFGPGRFLPLLAGMFQLLYAISGWGTEAICDVEYGDKVATLVMKPVADPYAITSVDPGGDFRFSSQYLAPANKLKTYVYHQSKNRYVLIHAAEYPVMGHGCSQDENGLGSNKVYSAQLERELMYRCRVVCQK